MYRDKRPPDDSAYLENLTHCVFQAGLNWRVIAQKWSNFQKLGFYDILGIKKGNKPRFSAILKIF